MKNKTDTVFKVQLIHDVPILCIIVYDFIMLLHYRAFKIFAC